MMLAAISINEIAEFFENLPSFWYYIGGGILLVLFFWAAISDGKAKERKKAEEEARREAEREAAEQAEKERIEQMPLIEERDGKTIVNTIKLPDGKTTLSGTYWLFNGERFRFYVESEEITIICLNGSYTIETAGGILQDLSFAYNDDCDDDGGYSDDEGEDDEDASFYDKYLGDIDSYYIKTHASQFGRIDWMDKTR